jgi:glutamine synthetase
MDVMDRVARRHKLRVLLHENHLPNQRKWKAQQLEHGNGYRVNLLALGKTPKTNLMFLSFFVNTIKAVHDYADVLRAAIASAEMITALVQTKRHRYHICFHRTISL